jgi:hypothetical protein
MSQSARTDFEVIWTKTTVHILCRQSDICALSHVYSQVRVTHIKLYILVIHNGGRKWKIFRTSDWEVTSREGIDKDNKIPSFVAITPDSIYSKENDISFSPIIKSKFSWSPKKTFTKMRSNVWGRINSTGTRLCTACWVLIRVRLIVFLTYVR